MNNTLCLIAITATGLCAGCETESPHFDSQLGTAAANMLRAQTLDPAANGNPPPFAPDGADGQRMKSAVDQYHKDIPKPEQSVARPIVFEVGQQSGGQ